MWTRLRSCLTYANVVSTLCLFLVIGGGGAYAKAKLIDGTQLKPRSITGAKIKKHSLTGTEVDVRKLGRVADAGKLGGKSPSAFLTVGSTGTNANALGGQPASAFLAAGRVVGGSGGPGGQPLFSYPPLGLTASSGSAWNIVVFGNASAEQMEVSRSSTNTIQQIAAGTQWNASPKSGATVETYVFRSIVRPTVALTVTCGFDHQPDIVNCAGIGIG